MVKKTNLVHSNNVYVLCSKTTDKKARDYESDKLVANITKAAENLVKPKINRQRAW